MSWPTIGDFFNDIFVEPDLSTIFTNNGAAFGTKGVNMKIIQDEMEAAIADANLDDASAAEQMAFKYGFLSNITQKAHFGTLFKDHLKTFFPNP